MNQLDSVNRVASVIIFVGSLLLLAVALQVAYWAIDNDPPFKLESYEATAAEPGGHIFIVAKVDRDLSRQCSTTFSRVFFDAKGARFELSEGAHFMNAQALNEMNKLSPGKLLLSIKVPENAAPGKATVMTVLDYVCNPVQMLSPIPVVISLDVEVLP